MCELLENQFASIAALIPLVTLATSYVARWLSLDGWRALATSWAIAMFVAILGCLMDCGFLAAQPFAECLASGALIAAGANGLYSYDGTKVVLSKIGAVQPSVKRETARP